MKEVEVGPEKDNIKTIIEEMIEVAAVDRSMSGSGASTNRDRIRCYKCKDDEYDHFRKDCPTSKSEKEAEHIQQMFNMDEEQTSLKTLVMDTYDNRTRVGTINNVVKDHLNL